MDLRRLYAVSTWCTVDAYALYAATAFLESKARARTTEEDEESSRSFRLLYAFRFSVDVHVHSFVLFGAGRPEFFVAAYAALPRQLLMARFTATTTRKPFSAYCSWCFRRREPCRRPSRVQCRHWQLMNWNIDSLYSSEEISLRVLILMSFRRPRRDQLQVYHRCRNHV